jgi:hypothetical protein
MESTITISGPNSLSVFDLNGRLFVFLGDQHQSFSGNCEEKYNIQCDKFDDEFNRSITYDTNCWNIGALLDEWFTYNNYFGISTDFYLETEFRKGDILRPFFPTDWIETLHKYFSDCLKQTKSSCKYGPNVKFHYTDIRAMTIDGNIMENSIYDVSRYFRALNETLNSKSLFEANINSIFDLFNILLNINLLLDLLFSTNDIRNVLNNIPVPQLSPDIQNAFNTTKNILINNASVRNGVLMYKPAAEFNRLLSLYPDIADKLQTFVHDRLNSFYTELPKALQVLYDKYLRTEGIDKNKLNIMKISLRAIVSFFESYIMDVYTISRMFIQQSEQVIVYAGGDHIKKYFDFLKYLGATLLTKYPAMKNNRCILIESSMIPNINDFRRIYKIVNPEIQSTSFSKVIEVEILCFRFHPITGSFNPTNKVPVDWSQRDSQNLSLTLINQINNNIIDLETLLNECRPYVPEYTSRHLNTEKHFKGVLEKFPDIDINHPPPYQYNEANCMKFLPLVEAYSEVRNLDIRALYQTGFDADLYAVILLYRNQYYGHIYTWLSPVDPSICCFMGIRNRVDNVFLKDIGDQLANVSYYLVEGVRRFALFMHCDKLVVVNARPIMREVILPKLGFVEINIPNYYTGTNINKKGPPTEKQLSNPWYHKWSCIFCLELKDIDKPIVDNGTSFEYIS